MPSRRTQGRRTEVQEQLGDGAPHPPRESRSTIRQGRPRARPSSQAGSRHALRPGRPSTSKPQGAEA
eukprot:6486841-Heterocapsa_arctica.AAC.1